MEYEILAVFITMATVVYLFSVALFRYVRDKRRRATTKPGGKR